MNARLGLTLLHFLWQGACIAAIYAIARTWMRSAQTRYALACITLAAMIAAPIVTFAISGTTAASETRPASVAVAHIHRAAPLAKDPALDPIPIVKTRSVPGEITPWLARLWLAGAMILWLRLLLTWMAAGRMTFRQVQPAAIRMAAESESPQSPDSGHASGAAAGFIVNPGSGSDRMASARHSRPGQRACRSTVRAHGSFARARIGAHPTA